MTTQKTFKRRVRDRMAKTGESYTAARRQLIAAGDRPDPGTPTYETVVSDEKMLEATGKTPRGVVRHPRRVGRHRPHPHRDRPLRDRGARRRRLVGPEHHRVLRAGSGMRAVGQMKDGWTINASKTVNVAIDELFDAVVEDADPQGVAPRRRPEPAHRHQAQVGSLRLGGRQHPGERELRVQGTEEGDGVRQPRAAPRRRHRRRHEGLLARRARRPQGPPREREARSDR